MEYIGVYRVCVNYNSITLTNKDDAIKQVLGPFKERRKGREIIQQKSGLSEFSRKLLKKEVE